MKVGKQISEVPPTMDSYKGAFNAIGRLFHACSSGWQGLDMPESINEQSQPCIGGNRDVGRLALADLADGPYFHIAMYLGVVDLCRADVACRLTRDLNRSSGGPWWAMGKREFIGLELDGDSIFDPAEDLLAAGRPVGGRKASRVDWKCRYMRFSTEVNMFRTPFTGTEITTVQQADEIAYCRHKLRSDILEANSSTGVYLEVQVVANPDNVSLAVVDFEAGGCSSVTFSPDTGAVIRERKIQEAPRKVEGTYIQPLNTITTGQGFEGAMGLFLQGGLLAFYRQHVERATEETDAVVGKWECTGFVTDLSWAEGRRLTPCLAFRDVGDYHVRVTRVNAFPPLPLARCKLEYDDSLWRSLDWDASEQDEVDM